MHTSVKRLLAAAGVLVWASPALAGRELTLDELPQAVRDAVEKETHDAKVTSIEQDTEDGRPIYEVEYTKNKARWELDIAADGTVLERHRD